MIVMRRRRNRLDDVVRDSLVKVSQNLDERASDTGRVRRAKRLVQRHHVVGIRHAALLSTIPAAIAPIATVQSADDEAHRIRTVSPAPLPPLPPNSNNSQVVNAIAF